VTDLNSLHCTRSFVDQPVRLVKLRRHVAIPDQYGHFRFRKTSRDVTEELSDGSVRERDVLLVVVGVGVGLVNGT